MTLVIYAIMHVNQKNGRVNRKVQHFFMVTTRKYVIYDSAMPQYIMISW